MNAFYFSAAVRCLFFYLIKIILQFVPISELFILCCAERLAVCCYVYHPRSFPLLLCWVKISNVKIFLAYRQPIRVNILHENSFDLVRYIRSFILFRLLLAEPFLLRIRSNDIALGFFCSNRSENEAKDYSNENRR